MCLAAVRDPGTRAAQRLDEQVRQGTAAVHSDRHGPTAGLAAPAARDARADQLHDEIGQVAISHRPAAGGLTLSDAAIARGVRPGWRAAWAYALLLIVTMAFAPMIWLIAAALGVGVLVLRVVRGQRSLVVPQALRLLAELLTPVVVLAPWSLTLFAHPSFFLREAGLLYRGGSASALDLVMLSPGGPKASAGWLLVGIGNLPRLPHTLYGQLLLTKLILFGAMLGLASLNRFRLTPAFEEAVATGDHGKAIEALRRSLAVEAGCAISILALVAWLGTLEPIATTA